MMNVLADNLLELIEEMAHTKPGTVRHASVVHAADCAIFDGDKCDCKPKFKMERPQ